MVAATGAVRWRGGPEALRDRLVAAGAQFTVVGSVAHGATEPHDLDVAVGASGIDLSVLLAAIGEIGGRSRLSGSMPIAARVREAGMWQFDTPYCGLDVFVDRSGCACD